MGLLVMPRLVAAAGFHRRQDTHDSGLFPSLVQHWSHMLLLTELLFAANEHDLRPVCGGDPLHVLPNGIAQRLSPFGVVENADLVLVAVVRHAFGIAPLRQRALDDDPVIAGENASDLALVPLGQQLHAHSGIIQLGAEVRSSGGFRGLAPAGEV